MQDALRHPQGDPSPLATSLTPGNSFGLVFAPRALYLCGNQLLLEIGMRSNSPPTATLDDSGLDRAALDALLTKARTQKKSSTLLSLAKGALLRVF